MDTWLDDAGDQDDGSASDEYLPLEDLDGFDPDSLDEWYAPWDWASLAVQDSHRST